MSEVSARRASPIRVAAVDFSIAEEVLRTAGLLIVPEDQSQRKAFEKLMPHLYVLRNKGCSWAQLAKLLGECGFKLQPSTVRTYFGELLAERMDICQARMNEQIAIMAAVRNETAGVDLAAISGRVQAHMMQIKQSARSRVDAMFGAAPASAIELAPEARAASTPSPARPAAAPRRPALAAPEQVPAQEDSSPGEFGLLGLSPANERSSREPAGFFKLDGADEPAPEHPAAEPAPRAPKARQPRATASAPAPAPSAVDAANPTNVPTSGATKKKVGQLQPGVPPLKRRDGVHEAVYQDGELEHPAIPGLMLSKEQRVYGASLEYWDIDGPDKGEIQTETPDQKRFRVVWRQTVPMARTRTGDSFTKMDTSIFKQD